jgi:hypothetical protein
MVTKKIDVDYEGSGIESHGALTLNPEEVLCDHKYETGEHTRVHPDGWTITAFIHEDYFYWVNEFEAVHPMYGRVWGDFESEVYADTEDGFQDFYAKHPPEPWDYYDI